VGKNTSSYKFEKRQREIARQKKQEEKRQRQQLKKQEKQHEEPATSLDNIGPEPSVPPTPPVTP
jgi:hypothetical protein